MANVPFQYTIFKPSRSKKASELMNMSDDELARRYLKKKTSSSPRFKSAFLDEVNDADEEGYATHWRMYSIAGANLDHIYSQLCKKVNKINDLGYEFRMGNVVGDIESLLSYDDKEVDKVSYDTAPLSVYTTEIAHFYCIDILSQRVLDYVENLANRGYRI
ncbi:MAG: hypothetical protein ACLRFL_00670 [Clostridia bacterium]